MERNQLNDLYKKIERKAQELCDQLHGSFGYYNGHYHKSEIGEYEMDYFPIPVISFKGICDIEIDFDQISVTTKLTRDMAISYNFEKVKSYSFEAYGVENYLDDLYIDGDTICDMIEKIQQSNETNVFFSFNFPFEIAASTLYEFVNFISKEGFFY